MDLTDVRMVQRRNRAGLLLEATDAVGVRGQILWQHLDGDVAIKACVARAIHLAHPAAAEERDDFVRAEAHTRFQGHLNISSRLYWQFQNVLARGQSAASRESDDQAGANSICQTTSVSMPTTQKPVEHAIRLVSASTKVANTWLPRRTPKRSDGNSLTPAPPPSAKRISLSPSPGVTGSAPRCR